MRKGYGPCMSDLSLNIKNINSVRMKELPQSSDIYVGFPGYDTEKDYDRHALKQFKIVEK